MIILKNRQIKLFCLCNFLSFQANTDIPQLLLKIILINVIPRPSLPFWPLLRYARHFSKPFHNLLSEGKTCGKMIIISCHLCFLHILLKRNYLREFNGLFLCYGKRGRKKQLPAVL